MRSSVGRVAFRGAAQYLLANGTRYAPVAALHPPSKKRELCTGSVVSNDLLRSPEDTDSAKVSALNVDNLKEPAVEIIAEETAVAGVGSISEDVSSTVQIERNAEEATAVGMSDEAYVPKRQDPDALREMLIDLLRNRSTRSALWHFAAALKVEGQPGASEDIVKMMLPILGRQGWAPTSLDTLRLSIERGYDMGSGLYNCGLHAMSRAGNSDEFNEILDGMWKLPKESQPNCTSYTYLIGSYVYSGHIDKAFEVLNEMKKHMIYPTFATYHALITGCLRKRDAKRAYSTLLAVEQNRFDVSAMTIAQVLVASAQKDDFDHVLVLMSKLEHALPRYATQMHRIAEGRHMYKLQSPERTSKEEREELRGNPKPELGAISAVLHCAFRGGRPDIAEAGWGMMNRHYPDLEVPPSLWYCMIGAYAGANDFSSAFDVLGKMREAGMTPSLKDLDMALIRPMSHDVSKVDEQFFRLVDRHEGKSGSAAAAAAAAAAKESPTQESVNDEVEAAVGDTLQAQQVDEVEAAAVDNVEKDVEGGEDIEETAGSGSSLADILAQPDLPTLPAMDGQQFVPTTVGIQDLNCIIAACSRAGDLDRAFQTYDEVQSRFGLERNVETYNALLEGCVQVRHIRGGLRVLQEMESIGVKQNETTVHLAVRLQLRARRLREAVEVVEKAKGEGVTVTLQTYQMLLRNALQGNEVDMAVDLAQEAETAGFDRRALTGRLKMDVLNKLRLALGEEIPPRRTNPRQDYNREYNREDNREDNRENARENAREDAPEGAPENSREDAQETEMDAVSTGDDEEVGGDDAEALEEEEKEIGKQ